MTDTINGRTPEEIKLGLVHCLTAREYRNCLVCPYGTPRKRGMLPCDCEVRQDILALINQLQEDKKQLERERDEVLQKNQQLERERYAAVRTARWQFEKRSDGSVTELPVCSGCGATPKYYVPMNNVGMQVPPYCHECGSRMAPVVKLEVEK